MALYVITGVAGFIGSALARAVLAQGDQVRGVDNLSTGRAENIAEVLDQIDFRECDINDAGKMSAACRGADYVLHQAAIASVPRSVREPEVSNRANVDGTLAVLMAARGGGVKRLVYAASSSAYGDTPTLPKREDMLPRPRSPYAVAKLAGELYAAVFSQNYGFETVSLRYFNVFGPRQDPASQYSALLAKFIPQMLRGEQLHLRGRRAVARLHLHRQHRRRQSSGLQSSRGKGEWEDVQRCHRHAAHGERRLPRVETAHRIHRRSGVCH